jgi:hypothetical protein
VEASVDASKEPSEPAQQRPPAAEPVPKIQINGYTAWEVLLTKKEDTQLLGFTHIDGKSDFLKRRQMDLDMMDQAQVKNIKVQLHGAGPEVLTIKRITENNLLHKWNQVHPDAAVRPGDLLDQVNDARTIEAMQKELRSTSVKLRVLRQPDFLFITLTKRADVQKLGFRFTKRQDCASGWLKITKVLGEGLLEEVNRHNISQGLFPLVVLPGMRIEAVNEVDGDPILLADELRRCDTARVRIRRIDAADLARRHKLLRGTMDKP